MFDLSNLIGMLKVTTWWGEGAEGDARKQESIMEELYCYTQNRLPQTESPVPELLQPAMYLNKSDPHSLHARDIDIDINENDQTML